MKIKEMTYYNHKINMPIVDLKNGTKIYGFDYIGDTQFSSIAIKNMQCFKQHDLDNIDMFITTEVKGIPFCETVAKKYNKNYICLRKSSKIYMNNPVEFASESITSNKQRYYIDEDKLKSLENKTVCFVDDVFSTGKTMDTIINICDKYKINLKYGLFILYEAPINVDNIVSTYITFVYKNITCAASGILPMITYDIN